MSDTVLIKQYNKEDIPPVNEAEVWRYAGYRGIPKESEGLLCEELSEVINRAERELTYKVVFLKSDRVPFEHFSKDLEDCLKDCDEIYMFAATIGLGIDRLIAVNERLSPTKALLLQALGAERVEALCDKFCDDIEAELKINKKNLTMRFSPGYGDLPLDTQREFFRILDCNRKIGISLNDSLLMSPSKSVTAIFGAKETGEGNIRKDWCGHKCETCPNVNCEYRGK